MDHRTITEAEFRAEVDRLVHLGSTFTVAVYKLIDELTAQADERRRVRLACGTGCDACCHQMVSCTSIEWAEIRRVLESGSISRAFRQVLREGLSRWRRYVRRKGLVSNPMELGRDWWGKPCMFLSRGGECRIYDVRPIDCRTYVSTIRCTLRSNSSVQRQRYRWERWANTMILEEEARQRGVSMEGLSITPLPSWLEFDNQRDGERS